MCREKVGEQLAEKVMYIAETMNKHEYLPKPADAEDLKMVFDTTFHDVQPYLHRVS